MRCKTCNGEGIMLERTQGKTEKRQTGEGILIEEHISFLPTACDCCGGWADNCENCRAGRRVINWIDPKEYENAFADWLYNTALPAVRSGKPDHFSLIDASLPEEQVKAMFDFLNQVTAKQRGEIRKTLEELIPGELSPVTVARRARLSMIQLLYDRGYLYKQEAWKQLDGNLSPDNPDTYFDDSNLLQLKENEDEKE